MVTTLRAGFCRLVSSTTHALNVFYHRFQIYTGTCQGCQITAFLRPNLQQCSLFFFVLAFCFLCLLDYTNDDLASKMQ